MRIIGAGTYLPHWRLSRSSFGGKGTRSIASYDEDTTSLGVSAAHRAVAAVPGALPSLVTFATTMPAYADRTNATCIHAALGLDRAAAAYDVVGSVRSGVAALRLAADAARSGERSLAVLADIRVGLPGSGDESEGGDGAAAFVFGDDDEFLAELIGLSSATAEFLDRWRIPGSSWSRVWEERFGEQVYLPLAQAAFDEAVKSAGLTPTAVDHVIVTGLHRRAVTRIRRAIGARDDAVTPDLSDITGTCGTAHAGILLAGVLEHATPGQTVAVLSVADGADCLVLRTGGLAGRPNPVASVRSQLAGPEMAYNDALVWRGLLTREPPRRPDPDRPAAPPSERNRDWKFGFVGSRCVECGTRHLPPDRVCFTCHSVDQMTPEPLAGVPGTVKTFAIDHLAFSVAPPVVVAVVDFNGGGRLQCELTDVDPASVRIGTRVELTFRRLYTTADGVHNYFWKARPITREES